MGTGAQSTAQADVAPSPGLFDALPSQDPAQAAAEAVTEAASGEQDVADATDAAAAAAQPRTDTQHDASHNA